ncbi:uncharacterized protein [Leptinotarsa decemlineata]|uniref:uncharacterized protein n=1 Tax=Leptinotarsa decemlineata TaxID=7539 RepID=UPI003D307BEC
MKSIIVFVVLVSGSLAGRLSHEKKEKLFSYHQGCVSKSGVDRKIITQMKQGMRSEDPKFKEYLLCLSQKFGFQNEAGEFQREVMREKLTQYARNASTVDAVMEKCVVQKDSPVESAYHYSMCHYDICRDHGPLFYVINISEKKKAIFHSYQKDCAAESGVNPTILENAQKEIFEDDPLLKKYAFCYSKKMGFQDENGKIDEQSFRGKLKELVENYDELEKLVSTCNVEKDNPENTAYEFFKCFLQNSHFNVYTVTN